MLRKLQLCTRSFLRCVCRAITFGPLTPSLQKHGDPLLVHIRVITDLVTGMLQPVLLDLALLTQDSTVKVRPPSTDQDLLSDLQPSKTDDCDLLKYHSPAKVADKVIETERRYLVDDVAAQQRLAQTCTDWAMIGPGTGNHAVLELNRKHGVNNAMVDGAS